MPKARALLVGTVVIALVAMVGWLEWRGRQRAAEIEQLRAAAAEFTAVREEVTRLRAAALDVAELEALRDSDLRLREEVARLRGQLGARLRAEAEREAKSQVQEAQPATATGGGMTEFIKGVADQQNQGRLARMRNKLNLTPEQEQAISAILRQQSEQGAALAQKMFAGKLTHEEMQQAGSAGGNPEEQIKALLSPEQLSRYADYQHEEAVSNARLAANAELLQLQMTVTMEPEQQDQAFAVLYDQTLALLEGSKVEPPPSSSPEAVMEWQISRKIKALEGILEPPQLQQYRALQETQLKMMKSLLPSGPNPGGP